MADLRERLEVLADNAPTVGEYERDVDCVALALAAARMALEDAKAAAYRRSADEWADKYDVCAAVASIELA